MTVRCGAGSSDHLFDRGGSPGELAIPAGASARSNDADRRGPATLFPEPAVPTAAVAYLLLVSVTSTASYAAYGFDKRRAGTPGARRVPERTLHLLALAGGWPGAMLAQRQFRHKTQKTRFRVVFWLTVVLHVLAAAAAAYLVVTLAHRTTP